MNVGWVVANDATVTLWRSECRPPRYAPISVRRALIMQTRILKRGFSIKRRLHWRIREMHLAGKR